MDTNLMGWVEIPATDINRAKAFYDQVFGINIQIQDFGGVVMGWFPFEEDKSGASGALVQHKAYQPSETHGTLVYFSSTDVAVELEKAKAAGGKVVQEKTQISPDIGYMGIFIDCEGNRIALHSRA